MQITCPNCATSYQVADAALGTTGRKVRCARCGTQWHAKPTPPPEFDEAMAEAEWEAMERAASAEAAAAPPPPSAPPSAQPARPAASDWTDALDEGRKRGRAGEALTDDDFGAQAPPKAAPAEKTAPAEEALAEAAGDMGDAAATAPDDTAPGTNVVPFPAPEEAAGAPPEGAAATIEADPPGFRPRSAQKPKAKPKRKPARPAPSPMMRRVMSGLVIGVAVTLVGLTLGGAFFAREAVVRTFPDLASLYALAGLEVNLRGLEFRDVRTYRELDGSAPILAVEGTAVNITREPQAVPMLRFALKSTVGREVYAWTMEPPKTSLDGGESLTFKSRLPAPPESATEVEVRFTDSGRP